MSPLTTRCKRAFSSDNLTLRPVLEMLERRSLLSSLTLSFDAPVPATLADQNGLGTGFTTRLPGTGTSLAVKDSNLDLVSKAGHLLLTSTQSDIARTGYENLPQLEAPGVLIRRIGTQDIYLSTRVSGIRVVESSDQVWLYAGSSATSVVRAGFHGPTNRYTVVANRGQDEGYFGDVELFDSGPDRFATGDEVVLSFGRTGGLWSLKWQNLTDPARSGSSPGLAIPFLDAQPDLYVGIMAMNVFDTPTTFTTAFDYFSAESPAIPAIPDGDDQLGEALSLALGATSRPHTIGYRGDVDFFRFAARAGDRIGFDVDKTPGSALDSFLRLFDADGNEVARNDNGSDTGDATQTSSYLEHAFARGGNYFVAVSAAGNTAYDPVTGANKAVAGGGGYTLTLVDRTLDPRLDGDDRLAEAVSIAVNSTSRSHTVGYAGDIDFFRFTAAAGQRIGFDVDKTPGSGLDSFLRLFDADGNELARNDNGSDADDASQRSSYLELVFADDGVYYAAISGTPNDRYAPLTGAGRVRGSTGGYTLRVGER